MYQFTINKGVLRFNAILFSGYFIKFVVNVLKIANMKKRIFNAVCEMC